MSPVRRATQSIAVFVVASSFTLGCHRTSPPSPDLTGACEPEIDSFAPSVTWAEPRQRVTRAHYHDLFESPQAMLDDVLEERVGLWALEERRLPPGVTEVRVWTPGCSVGGYLIRTNGTHFAAAAVTNGWQLVGIEPTASWPELWKRLTSEGLMKLPDDDKMPTLHGWSTAVEIRTGNEYRNYTWDTPELRDEPEAKAILRITELLHRSFSAVWS